MSRVEITNQDWRNALQAIYKYCETKFSNELEYSTRSLETDHGCPPPITELEQYTSTNEGVETDTLWQGQRVLWCYPANPNKGEKLKKDEKVPVACLGTAFWAIIHAFKILGVEEKIPAKDMRILKTTSLKDPLGLAKAFVDLEWAKEIFTNPNDAQGGDVGVIGYKGNLPHHWFIVAEEPHIEVKGNKALNTWAASPLANGAGFDYWFKERENDKNEERYWILARPFSF